MSAIWKVLHFAPAAMHICNQLNATSHSKGPHIHVGLRKPLIGALAASAYYDLTQSSFGRRRAQLIGARSAATVWIIDYLIDDFGLPDERRLSILSTLRDSIETGRVYRFNDLPQLSNASRQLSTLRRSVVASLDARFYIDCFCRLADAAKDQITQPPSLELTARLGGLSMQLFASVPYCWNPTLSPRYLKAAHNLGAYFQIFDDLFDRDRDLAYGNKTFATLASNPEEVLRLGVEAAGKHLEQAYADLPPSNHWIIKALLASGALGLRQVRAFSSILPLSRLR